MTIAAADFRQQVVVPALLALEPAGIPCTQIAADLLMATAAIESGLGTYLVQRGGPALGVFQIQPASLASCLTRLTSAQRAALGWLKNPQGYSAQVATNLVLAAAICRLFYWQVPTPLPLRTADGLWGYYKRWWNTLAGAATEAEFLAALKLTDIFF